MNLRNPKVIRIGGWGAVVATLLAVAAGAYLASGFFQSGNVLNGGIIAGMTVVSAVFGGLLSYFLFLFASMQPVAAETAAQASTTESEIPAEGDAAGVEPVAELAPAGEDEAIAIAVTTAPLPPLELSDDELPTFHATQSALPGDVDSDDFTPSVPPPIDALDDSDAISVERSVSADDFDSRMDLPVTVDGIELNVEELDEVPPAVQSPTSPVVSALTQTDEVDAIEEVVAESVALPAEPQPALPEPAAEAGRPSPVEAFPEIFKSPTARTLPTSLPPAPAPAPVPERPAAKSPVTKSSPATVARQAPEKPRGARSPEPQPAKAETQNDDALPVVDDLSDIAITLGPVTPAGALPSEIPDFFLKMPTGRSLPTAMPAMPVAPVAPRAVAAPKVVHHAQAVVRIIDSTSTGGDGGDDLVTMTAIPDDWPS